MLRLDEEPFFRRRAREPLRIGVTPLIDIVFLLLIFFMLTSRFVMQEGIEVDLPYTVKPHELAGSEVHVIYLRKDGTFLYGGTAVDLPILRRILSALPPPERMKPFEVRSDREASIQSMVTLLELLRDVGAVKVTVGTVHDVMPEAP